MDSVVFLTVKFICCRYRKWNLGDGIELIVRCEHDAMMLGPNGEESFINVKTLNEWDPRVCVAFCLLRLTTFGQLFFFSFCWGGGG